MNIFHVVGGLLDVQFASSRCFDDIAGLALRDNPRRAHLIVSKLLGKHIPVAPHTILEAGHQLGAAVKEVTGLSQYDDSLVLGYCETATGLGHAVAEELEATYLHTTRKAHPALLIQAEFEEEHSHAVAHLIQPDGHISLSGAGPLILVDDELSTGTTALNTLAALHAKFPRPFYIIATLLDARTDAGRTHFDAHAESLGLDVKVVALHTNHLTLPADVLARAVEVRAALAPGAAEPTEPHSARLHIHDSTWPESVPTTARHGMTWPQTEQMHAVAAKQARRLTEDITDGDSVLVLGTEELLHAATHVAASLAAMLPRSAVVNQSTTRSPVHAANEPGYAVRRSLAFTCPDDPTRISRVHNLFDPGAVASPVEWADQRHDHIVVVVDATHADSADMLAALLPFAHHVHFLPVPVAAPVHPLGAATQETMENTRA